jgi:hypothetical protein
MERKILLKKSMFNCSFVAYRKIAASKCKNFLVFQNVILWKTWKFQKTAKNRVFIFESLAWINLYFKLIGESMRKNWLRFSDPWCLPWVVSPEMSHLQKNVLQVTTPLRDLVKRIFGKRVDICQLANGTL